MEPEGRFTYCRAKHLQKWQYKRETTRFKPVGAGEKTLSHYHLAPEGWLDLPDGGSAATRSRPR